MADWLTTQDDIADELERIGFVPNSADRYDFRSKNGILYARIVYESDKMETWDKKWGMQNPVVQTPAHFIVHFAQVSTFDRWANSTNFEIHIDAVNPSADLEGAKKKAEEICKSEIFNFWSYFHSIDLS